ncbi:MAG: hypothetical protein GY953_08175, partial [bacterium]|nr:hypothetical protein [bacterium]
LVAEVVGQRDTAVFFRGSTQETTHRLSITCNPTFSAVSGVVKARISAVDYRGRPVTGAKITFEGTIGADELAEGAVRELGGGEYEGAFKTHLAGCWTLIAQDQTTGVLANRCVQVLPAGPAKLRLVGKTDPRTSDPYGERLARGRLEDRFGNALPPDRIRCRVDGRYLNRRALVGDEAHFSVRSIGYSKVQLQLRDSKSRLSSEEEIRFSAVWLSDPGMVFTGSAFSTGIFGLPPVDRPAQKAT